MWPRENWRQDPSFLHPWQTEEKRFGLWSSKKKALGKAHLVIYGSNVLYKQSSQTGLWKKNRAHSKTSTTSVASSVKKKFKRDHAKVDDIFSFLWSPTTSPNDRGTWIILQALYHSGGCYTVQHEVKPTHIALERAVHWHSVITLYNTYLRSTRHL